MMNVWPSRCVPMMKQELKYYGLLGVAGMLTGSVFVDRFNKEKAIETCKETLEHLKKHNVKLWVFPEGTRGHDDVMLPFKKGAFHLAVQGQLPVVPVVFSSYAPFYNKNSKKFLHEGFAIAEVLDPISTAGLSSDDVTPLAERTREIMMQAYQRISPEAAQRYAAKEF